MFKAKLRHGIPGDPELGQYAVNEPADHEPADQPGSGLENEHGGSVGSSLSEKVESDQGDGNAGSNLGEDVGSNQGNDTTWGRPRPRFEELLPDSDSEVEDTEVEDYHIVQMD